MKTVAAFNHVHEAHLVRCRLEAEGLSAFISDENLVSLNWMYSQAVGGVKVQVADEDYERALRILRADHNMHTTKIHANEIDEECCPSCGSSATTHPYSPWSLIPSFILAVPVFFRKKYQECTKCGARWPVRKKRRPGNT